MTPPRCYGQRVTDDSKNPLFLLALKRVCMCERESVPKADFIFFPDNNNKAWCLVAGFHPNPNAFRRCFEFAAAGDLAVGFVFYFYFEGVLYKFSFFFFFWLLEMCRNIDQMLPMC